MEEDKKIDWRLVFLKYGKHRDGCPRGFMLEIIELHNTVAIVDDLEKCNCTCDFSHFIDELRKTDVPADIPTSLC